MTLLIVVGVSLGPERPGNSASLARKASTSALVMDPTGRSPNSASRWASNVASTLLRCWRRHWGAISLRQVTEKSEKVGVSGIAGAAGRELPPGEVGKIPPTPAAGAANWAALWLPGNVAA